MEGKNDDDDNSLVPLPKRLKAKNNNDNNSLVPLPKRLKGKHLREFVKQKLASNTAPRVVLDCRFESFMQEKDISKLSCQINQLYGYNMKAPNPLRLITTSFGGRLKERLKKGQQDRLKTWLVDSHEQPLEETYTIENGEKDNIIYLTSESPNDLETVESDKIYVIGAWVDHNSHKGYTYKMATEKGWKTAKLPILKYMDREDNSSARLVITVNQVFSALVEYWNWKDWRKALYCVLPKRKGFVLKDPLTEKEISQIKPVDNQTEDPIEEKQT